MHPKCIRNVSEMYPKFNLLSLDLSHSSTIKIKTSIHISSYITYIIYPKFNLLSLYLTYSNTVKIPNASQMHQKCIRNVSQIQPSLSRSQSLKYYKNQNNHTYFFLYYLYLSQIYPKFNLLSLYFTYSNTVKSPKFIPNLLADEKGLKLDQIPPVPRYITHKIKDYIPCVYFKVNRVGF